MSFLKTRNPSLWNVNIKGDFIPFYLFVWESRSLISKRTFFQVPKLCPVRKTWKVCCPPGYSQFTNKKSPKSEDELCVKNCSVKCSYLRLVIVSWYHVPSRLFLSVYIKGWGSFCLCRMMRLTFWLNAYAVINLFSFSTTFMERISVFQEDLSLIILPQQSLHG